MTWLMWLGVAVAWLPVHAAVGGRVYRWALEKWDVNPRDIDDAIPLRIFAVLWPVALTGYLVGLGVYKSLIEKPVQWAMREKKQSDDGQAELPTVSYNGSVPCQCAACVQTSVNPALDPYRSALGLVSRVDHRTASQAFGTIFRGNSSPTEWETLCEYFGYNHLEDADTP